jgi:hypothetical protein
MSLRAEGVGILRDDRNVNEDEGVERLRRELSAEEDTFLLRLRGDRIEWDKGAFTRFEQALRWGCEHYQGQDQLDRWMVEGFHYVSWFIRDWTSHPNFPRPEPEQYYHDCIKRVDDLADWFFRGHHAYREPHHWPDI